VEHLTPCAESRGDHTVRRGALAPEREQGDIVKALKVGPVLGLAVLLLPSRTAAAPRRPPQPAPSAAKGAFQVDAVLGDVIDRLWSRGDWYWHEGRYEERVALDRLVIRMEPRFAEAYGTAGWLLESLGRDEEALALYRQGTTAAPDRWETHQDLGMYLYQHKQYPAAADAFKQATRQAEAPPYTWKMLAHAYEHSGALEQAVAAWEEAGRVAPEDGAVAVNLQRVRARLNGTGTSKE
jgi:tetratricopeptide (TPR) repeat protein